MFPRGKEFYAFEYERSGLQSGQQIRLDPDLLLYRSAQYTSGTKGSFGMFLDSAPDRWDRVLMSRREQLSSKQEGRKPKKLQESDYTSWAFQMRPEWEHFATDLMRMDHLSLKELPLAVLRS